MEKKLSVVGIDIAQQVFHLVGMDEQGTILVLFPGSTKPHP